MRDSKFTMSVIGRFEAKYDKFGPIHPELKTRCWVWTAGKFKTGYGQFDHKIECYAHRLSYQLYLGPIAKGLHVLHKCDNRVCVNPKHLFLGANLDNIKDMVSKERNSAARGEDGSNHILTEKEVIEIRERYSRPSHNVSNARQLAVEFGVSVICIQEVIRRITWKHLP